MKWICILIAPFSLMAVSCDSTMNGNGGNEVEPVFAADYRTTFTEVRDCRLGIEHGGFMIRVFANDIALEPYLNNANPLPVGSVLVKEEFNDVDCANDSQLVQWRAMRKEAAGFDPDDGDWQWQRVLASREVVESTKASCIACHRVPDCLQRDYQCTVP